MIKQGLVAPVSMLEPPGDSSADEEEKHNREGDGQIIPAVCTQQINPSI